MEENVEEWEAGLPEPNELAPLSQILITPELACAFSISPETSRTHMEVKRASQNTISLLRRNNSAPNPQTDDYNAESVSVPEQSGNENGEEGAKASKRSRLVWTPQLHRRFVDVVSHLGITNCVPKTIMGLMNVEGLTRENVSSHLQKYRLYLKRMQFGNQNHTSDTLFASSPLPSPSNANPLPMHQQMGYFPPHGHGHGHDHGHGYGRGHMAASVPSHFPYASMDPHAYAMSMIRKNHQGEEGKSF